MQKYFDNSFLAFCVGFMGGSVLFGIVYLVFNVAHVENPFPPTLLGLFLNDLFLVSFIEEGVKLFLIKIYIGRFPYGFPLGLGFGMGETILVNPFFEFGAAPLQRAPAILLHIVTAGIISYFIKKNKPVMGFCIAIVIHTGFNLIIDGGLMI